MRGDARRRNEEDVWGWWGEDEYDEDMWAGYLAGAGRRRLQDGPGSEMAPRERPAIA